MNSSPGSWRYYGKDCFKIKDKKKRAKCEKRRKMREKLVSRIRLQIARGKTIAVLDSGDPLIYGPMAWYLEEFKDLNPVVIPGVSCFNAANAALRKCITSGEKIHKNLGKETACTCPCLRQAGAAGPPVGGQAGRSLPPNFSLDICI